MGEGAHAPSLLRGRLAQGGAEILHEGVGLLRRRGEEEDGAFPGRPHQLRRGQGLGGSAKPDEPDRPARVPRPAPPALRRRRTCFFCPCLHRRHRSRNANMTPLPAQSRGAGRFRARVYLPFATQPAFLTGSLSSRSLGAARHPRGFLLSFRPLTGGELLPFARSPAAAAGLVRSPSR